MSTTLTKSQIDAEIALLELDELDFPIDFLQETLSQFKSVVENSGGLDTDDILEWGTHYIDHYFILPPSVLHMELCEDLQEFQHKRGLKKNRIAPRGSAKSTIVTLVYVLYCICHKLESYILLVSDTLEQAIIFLQAIKAELEDNDRIIADYPHVTGETKLWRANKILTQNKIIVESVGKGSKIRGRRNKQARPSLIIGDDMENDDHIYSPTLRDKFRNWVNKALLKVGNKDTNIIFLGTVLHRECILLELEATPVWETKKYRALMEWPTNMTLWAKWELIFCDVTNPTYQEDALAFYTKNKKKMDKGAKLLWEENENLYELMQMRIVEGKNAFESEKQGNPVNPDSCEWEDSVFQDEGIWFEEWPDDKFMTLKVVAIDPSKGKESKRGDYSAILKMGMNSDGHILIEADLARRPASQIVEDGIEIYADFGNCYGVAIETNQFQELLCTEFQRVSRERGIEIPIFQIYNTIKKDVRIRRVGPYLRQKVLKFKLNSPSTLMLINQLRDFPNADHDDGPDTLEMGLRTMIELDHDISLQTD